jgi:hypothetical protein
LATRILFAFTTKVYAALVDTIVVPSVQLTKVYPAEGVAVAVVEAPDV